MRLRLTMVTMLTVGIVMSGAGVALASPDVRQSDNAAAAQYQVVGAPNQPDRQVILPFQERHTGTSPTNQQERVMVLGPPPFVERVQGVRQVEAGSSLPFTGFAAAPVLLLGAALLITGMALRRKGPQEG
jgi:hypothetical protein